MSLPARTAVRQALGYGAFALFSFLFSLYWTFDYSLLIPRISQAIQQATGSEVRIEELEGYRLSGVRMAGITLSRPSLRAGATAESSLTVEQMTLRLNLVPLLWGRRSLSLTAGWPGAGSRASFRARASRRRWPCKSKG